MKHHLGYGHDKLAAPFGNAGHLPDDFIFQIPWQYQDVVRSRFSDPIGMENRYAHAGHEVTLFVRAEIDGIVDEIGSHAAVVQQRHALGSGAVSDDAFAFSFGADQKLEQLAFGLFYLFRKGKIGFEPPEPSGFLSCLELSDPVGRGF